MGRQVPGRFDQGWDVLREETFARQRELGAIPADAELTARHDVIPAWDDMAEELKPVLARQMENHADDTTFTGTIKWLELEAGEDSHDHLIDSDHFIHVAMAHQ